MQAHATLPPLRGRVQHGAVLAPLTWFRVGGPADVLVRPADVDALLLLLRDLGLLPTLDAETATLANLRPEGRYTLVAEGGLRTASQADRASLAGSQWRALQEALDEAASYTATLRACAPVAAELKPQLRAVLQYHCGSPVLRTRQLMMDLQSL